MIIKFLPMNENYHLFINSIQTILFFFDKKLI